MSTVHEVTALEGTKARSRRVPTTVVLILGIFGSVFGLVGGLARDAETLTVPVYPAAPDAAQAAAAFVPARRLSGSLPPLPPPNVTGWIDERFEVLVDAMGRSAGLVPFRSTPMSADPIAPAVADWRFRPAVDQSRAVQSRVLIAAMVRPPQLYDAPTLGTPPADRATPSDEIPFPLASPAPLYPPLGVSDAVVLVEVLVGLDGRVREARVISGAPGFQQASLDAAQDWLFRPARWNARVVEAYSYLIFGFRRPLATVWRSGAPLA